MRETKDTDADAVALTLHAANLPLQPLPEPARTTPWESERDVQVAHTWRYALLCNIFRGQGVRSALKNWSLYGSSTY